MTEKELKHLKSDCEYFLNGSDKGEINLYNFIENLRTTYIKPKEKRIEELKLKLEALEGQTPWKDIKDKSELIKENAELKKLFADCDTCKRICDIGNCCKFGSDYLPDVEKVLNKQEQLTKAKEILNIAMEGIKYWGIVGGTERPFEKQAEMLFNLFLDKAEQFLKE